MSDVVGKTSPTSSPLLQRLLCLLTHVLWKQLFIWHSTSVGTLTFYWF